MKTKINDGTASPISKIPGTASELLTIFSSYCVLKIWKMAFLWWNALDQIVPATGSTLIASQEAMMIPISMMTSHAQMTVKVVISIAVESIWGDMSQ